MQHRRLSVQILTVRASVWTFTIDALLGLLNLVQLLTSSSPATSRRVLQLVPAHKHAICEQLRKRIGGESGHAALAALPDTELLQVCELMGDGKWLREVCRPFCEECGIWQGSTPAEKVALWHKGPGYWATGGSLLPYGKMDVKLLRCRCKRTYYCGKNWYMDLHTPRIYLCWTRFSFSVCLCLSVSVSVVFSQSFCLSVSLVSSVYMFFFSR